MKKDVVWIQHFLNHFIKTTNLVCFVAVKSRNVRLLAVCRTLQLEYSVNLIHLQSPWFVPDSKTLCLCSFKCVIQMPLCGTRSCSPPKGFRIPPHGCEECVFLEDGLQELCEPPCDQAPLPCIDLK